jgi:uncharacterized GH25 family protein
MMLRNMLLTITLICTWSSSAQSHDTWLETGTATVAVGEYAYIDLMLGNHGNDHRDFKLASKISLDPCTLSVMDPTGQVVDLKSEIVDMGSAEKEGFWTAKYVFADPGLHRFIHTLDTLHRTTRAIKSAKTFVLAIGAGEQKIESSIGDACHGFELELVLKTPFDHIEAGAPIELQVMRSGKAFSQALVTFIPLGTTLAAGFDAEYQRTSDSDGIVRFVPEEGNLIFAVVHHMADGEAGDGYENTHYSAAMVIQVPNQAIRRR